MIKEYIFNNTGIMISQAQEKAFEDYFNLLTEWNKKFNLTAITQKEEVYVKHFADSITGSFALKQNAVVCDIGSGGGFPSIPLAIIRPDLKFVLLDSVNKKITFLKEIISNLNLNAEAVCVRAEEYVKRDFFDAVVVRAVAAVPTLLEYSAPLLKLGGVAVMYKTPREDISASQNAQKVLSMSLTENRLFSLPNGDNRAIFVFSKTAPTDKKYPRKANKPKLNPL
ncbi:MAG TPA: 16S rRNA (guanine(527)-N(7))-methyltransferase RsmG [Eubacteriales bacterium]|nr:16S rRNA (guanine(527)-N(7))-methyltransferase RsmG [Eubacteriales bacterium]